MAEKRKKRMKRKPFFTGKNDCNTGQGAGQPLFEKNVRFFPPCAACPDVVSCGQAKRAIPAFILPWKGDYGDAHTGIAISDPTGLLAGFTTVINAYRPDRVTEQIALLAKEHRVERLVLGHPINMDGTRGPRSEKAQAMRQLLEETTGLPVVLWDERRTTIDAHQILMSSGKNAKKRKKVVDAVAASLILEGYLTYLKTHPEG